MKDLILKGSLYWAGMLAGWALHFKDWKWIPCVIIAFFWYWIASLRLEIN